MDISISQAIDFLVKAALSNPFGAVAVPVTLTLIYKGAQRTVQFIIARGQNGPRCVSAVVEPHGDEPGETII